jgi:hypothetical protein
MRVPRVAALRCGSIAAALFATLSLAPPIQSQPYYVRAATRVQTGGFGVIDPQYIDANTGNVQAHSISTGPHTASSNAGTVIAIAYSLSELGALHGYGSINAHAGAGGAPAGGDAQITGAAWSDTFTVTSDTLPQFTPVQLQATLTFHRSLDGGGADVLVQTNSSISGQVSLSISDTLASPNSTQSVSDTFTAYVGIPFQMSGQLYFQINGAASSGNSPVSGSVDISNTATFNLVSLNPAASYSTASGVMYNVPEPATISLVIVSALCAGCRRMRVPV